MIGYKTDMIFLPDHGVGAVLLTNSDAGQLLLGPFSRKLLEVLFEGEAEADSQLAAAAKALHARIAAEPTKLTVPAAAEHAKALARAYTSPALGDIAVSFQQPAGGASFVTTTFDFGERKSEVASRKNADGTVSFITIAPGMQGLEFVVSDKDRSKRLLVRDAQHEYVFTERAATAPSAARQ